MVEQDLNVSRRLKNLLPALTSEELSLLETNIEEDGRVTDAIIFWNDGKKNVIVDGMHRLPIAKRLNVPYRTEPLVGPTTYEEVELWMLNRQLGRRNLLKPEALRKLRGDLYNRLKCRTEDGPPKCPNGQNVRSNAAKKVAQETGVTERTVRRDGKYAEALSKLAKPLREDIETGRLKATDAEVLSLASVDRSIREAVTRDLRVENAKTITDALALHNVKVKKPRKKKGSSESGHTAATDSSTDAEPQESISRHPRKGKDKSAGSDYGKCPNCAGTKWKSDEDGVFCARCRHPHGEATGGPDEDRVDTQRSKLVKTLEAAMRAIDDMHLLLPKPKEHADAIATCKILLKTAKAWKVQ